MLLIGLWSAILCIIMLVQLVRYIRFRRQVSTQLCVDNELEALLHEQTGSSHKLNKSSVRYLDAQISPFTFGVFHPTIVLTNSVSKEEMSLVLRHELQHIQSRDFPIRTIAMFAILLHCFNPFIYLFWRELIQVQELCCDEKLTGKFTSEQKKQYGYLLIAISSASETVRMPAVYFTRDKVHFLQKRIHKLVEVKKPSPVLVVLLSLMVLGTACIPAAAYTPDTLEAAEFDIIETDGGVTDWIYLSAEEDTIPEDESTFRYVDAYLILEDGSILPYDPADAVNTWSICSHSWQKVALKRHEKNSKGGCTVYCYDAMRCKKCGNIKNQTKSATFSYNKCPH